MCITPEGFGLVANLSPPRYAMLHWGAMTLGRPPGWGKRGRLPFHKTFTAPQARSPFTLHFHQTQLSILNSKLKSSCHL